MWYCTKEHTSINLEKITAIKIKSFKNKFKVFATYIEAGHIEYVLDTFDSLQEAQNFVEAITNALNGVQPEGKLGYAFTWLAKD